MKKNALVVKNSLGYNSNLLIYQDKSMFNYSIDTILLGNFVEINSSTKRILDVGTNNAALSIFLSARYKKMKIDAIEIQKKAIKLAKKNVELNNMEKQINLISDDFNNYWKKVNIIPGKRYDIVVCNPPFYKVDSTLPQTNDELAIATHEHKLNLEQLIHGSSKILNSKGKIFIVHQTNRLVDIFTLMRKYNFEPKRVQMIYPRRTSQSNLVLVEGRLNSGWGTRFLKPLFLHKKNSRKYRWSIRRIYKPLKVK